MVDDVTTLPVMFVTIYGMNELSKKHLGTQENILTCLESGVTTRGRCGAQFSQRPIQHNAFFIKSNSPITLNTDDYMFYNDVFDYVHPQNPE